MRQAIGCEAEGIPSVGILEEARRHRDRPSLLHIPCHDPVTNRAVDYRPFVDVGDRDGLRELKGLPARIGYPQANGIAGLGFEVRWVGQLQRCAVDSELAVVSITRARNQ